MHEQIAYFFLFISYLYEGRLSLGRGNAVCNIHLHFQEAHCTHYHRKIREQVNKNRTHGENRTRKAASAEGNSLWNISRWSAWGIKGLLPFHNTTATTSHNYSCRVKPGAFVADDFARITLHDPPLRFHLHNNVAQFELRHQHMSHSKRHRNAHNIMKYKLKNVISDPLTLRKQRN